MDFNTIRTTILSLALSVTCTVAAQIPDLTFQPVPIPQPRNVNPYMIGGGTGGRIWFSDITFFQVGYFDGAGALQGERHASRGTGHFAEREIR